MRNYSEDEHDQGYEGGDRMDDQDGREGIPGRVREVEVALAILKWLS